MRRLILASTSAYKRQLLGRLRLPFETINPAVDESAAAGERPQALAARLARAKAEAAVRAEAEGVAHAGAGAVPGAVVIGADQVPALGDEVLRKPGSHAAALRQLTSCRGRTVVFYTAAAVLETGTGRSWETVDVTEVDFAELAPERLDRYLELERPYDCAGGFKAEALGIVLFEAIRSNDPTALIGLPLIWVARALRSIGFDPLD
ncbi:MAG TPA: Maf family nucleotide pyrophosphatase [Gammaproteobacteria bacterium]|nr:Maf family nucleotide pyrophosphatase [Gammaproteobacteria bacterium]